MGGQSMTPLECAYLLLRKPLGSQSHVGGQLLLV
jgi:hypothetical protein